MTIAYYALGKILYHSDREGDSKYMLMFANFEVKRMFRNMVKGWFGGITGSDYNDFIKALLIDDKKAMNRSR